MKGLRRSALWLYFVYLPGLVALFVFCGGLAEYAVEVRSSGSNIKTPGDGIWWAIVTLTTIGYGDHYPTTLPGRLIATVVMILGIGILGVFTAGTAAYLVRNDLNERFRLRKLRDHVVICGLGEKGMLLTKAFHAQGMTVVNIESEENNPRIGICREEGSIVLVGDAGQVDILRSARILQARWVIAVCGRDALNAEVAAHARDVVKDRSGPPLVCATHIIDPNLWYLLRRWELTATGAIRLQFFNVYDLGAQAMLNAFPPFPESGPPMERPPHILVIGAGQLGQSLVAHAARRWREHPASAGNPMRATLLDRDTTYLHEHMHLRHAGLEKVCVVDVRTVDVESPAFYKAEFLFDEAKRISVTSIYLCMRDDARNLSAALVLHHHARRHRVPIVIRTDQQSGLSELLGNVHSGGDDFDNIHAFPLLEHTCQPFLVLGGMTEALSRAIHVRYLLDQKRKGEEARSNPALVPWDDLPEDLKESNRRATDYILLQLKQVGCDLAPLTEWDAGDFAFSPEEIESMAVMEHSRWLAERKAHGWTYGPRDPKKKTNPNLVSWEELPEDSKTYNRDIIGELPVSLARAGFQIYRLVEEKPKELMGS